MERTVKRLSLPQIMLQCMSLLLMWWTVPALSNEMP